MLEHTPKFSNINFNGGKIDFLRFQEEQFSTPAKKCLLKIVKLPIDGVIKMSENITQQLYNYLLAGCDIMRGPINQDDYKTYITPLLVKKGTTL